MRARHVYYGWAHERVDLAALIDEAHEHALLIEAVYSALSFGPAHTVECGLGPEADGEVWHCDCGAEAAWQRLYDAVPS